LYYFIVALSLENVAKLLHRVRLNFAVVGNVTFE